MHLHMLMHACMHEVFAFAKAVGLLGRSQVGHLIGTPSLVLALVSLVLALVSLVLASVSMVLALVSLVLALVSLVLAVIPVAMAVARPMAMPVAMA